MRVTGDNNKISEDVFDFMISYLPFPQKSIRSVLTKPFSISIFSYRFVTEGDVEPGTLYLKHVLENQWLNIEIECSFEMQKNFSFSLAKRFGPGQPARTAQADLGQYVLQMH